MTTGNNCQGLIYTAKCQTAPPGQRTSPQLERMKEAKAKLESGQLDFNALDEYVNFGDANKGLDGLIGQIQGSPGTAGDYAAQAARGLLGFGKDVVMGVGELAYEGVKGVPKLGRMAFTSNGQAINQLNGAILAENIRLGNITPGTVGQGALDIGAAIVKPITDPWKRGDYVESVTRGAAEALTAPIALTKAQRAAQAAKAKAALDAAKAAKARAALEAAEAAKAKAALEAREAAKAGDGFYVDAKPVIRTAGSIRNVNPGYPNTPGRTQNCVNCSQATDSTLGGNPASALPSSGPVGIDVLESQYGSRFSNPMSSTAIQNQMLNAGNGARGIVFGARGPGEVGHVFNVVNQNGVVRFLDGQVGRSANLNGYTNFHLLRTNTP